jgi:LAO/AO transport system kinase
MRAGADSYVEDLVRRLTRGERAALARAITLVESRRADHQQQARTLIAALTPSTGRAMRVGVTGSPGVGKSTFIDTLGANLTAMGRRVAVIAVDPSSSRSGGSILGDKTRMARLAADPNAYIRPSPASGTLGGVARRTRETMTLCEAAGFDVLLVETVGVGQSETAVADMTDFFLVLVLPGAGDELQGVKRGVVELADMVAINKVDLDPAAAALTAAEYSAALRILAPPSSLWAPSVVIISGLANQGLDELWRSIERHRAMLEKSGELEKKRAGQRVKWMWAILAERLRERLVETRSARARLAAIEAEVASGGLTPEDAADRLLESQDRG